jgi:hypothetical protein
VLAPIFDPGWDWRPVDRFQIASKGTSVALDGSFLWFFVVLSFVFGDVELEYSDLSLLLNQDGQNLILDMEVDSKHECKAA